MDSRKIIGGDDEIPNFTLEEKKLLEYLCKETTKDEIEKELPNINGKKFLYSLFPNKFFGEYTEGEDFTTSEYNKYYTILNKTLLSIVDKIIKLRLDYKKKHLKKIVKAKGEVIDTLSN